MITKRITLKLVAALFAVSMLSLSSCDKDDEPAAEEPAPEPAKSKTELLTAGYWKLTAAQLVLNTHRVEH